MFTELTWWTDEPWWEKKLIVFGGFSLSPRQLGTLLFFTMVGLVLTALVRFPIMGVQAGGKFLVFFLALLAGYAVSSLRVKLVPLELQVVYSIRNRGQETKGAPHPGRRSAQLPGAGALPPHEGKEDEQVLETASRPRTPKVRVDQEIEVSDFATTPPLMFTGSAKVTAQAKVTLSVNGVERESDVVSPLKPEYRVMYHPKEADIGVNEFAIKLEGQDRPLKTQLVSVAVKGRDMLDSKKRS